MESSVLHLHSKHVCSHLHVTVYCCVHMCRRHYLIPVVLLLLHSKDRVDVVFKQFIGELTQTGMVLNKGHQQNQLHVAMLCLLGLKMSIWKLIFFSHHLSAPCVDIIFQVTQAVVWHDNPCKPAV